MKPQLLKVKTASRMLFIKGRLVRTPLEAIIKSIEELNLLKSSMANQGIEYDIEDYNPKPIVKKTKIIKKKNKKETLKTKKKPKTLLEKISAEGNE